MAIIEKKTQQSAAQCNDLKTDLHSQCFGYVQTCHGTGNHTFLVITLFSQWDGNGWRTLIEGSLLFRKAIILNRWEREKTKERVLRLEKNSFRVSAETCAEVCCRGGTVWRVGQEQMLQHHFILLVKNSKAAGKAVSFRGWAVGRISRAFNEVMTYVDEPPGFEYEVE